MAKRGRPHIPEELRLSEVCTIRLTKDQARIVRSYPGGPKAYWGHAYQLFTRVLVQLKSLSYEARCKALRGMGVDINLGEF